jgi:hypothetical protein
MLVQTKAQMQAIQFTGDTDEIENFTGGACNKRAYYNPHVYDKSGYYDFEDLSDNSMFTIKKGNWLVYWSGHYLTFHNDYFKEFFTEVK